MPLFLNLTKNYYPVRRTKFFKNIFRTSSGWRFLIFVLIIFFGIMNLIILNKASTRGYELRNLERRITELKKENQRLNLEISRLSSPQLLEESAKNLGMEQIRKIRYFSPTNGILVVR
jgi:cell division protein FtsL